MNKKKTDVFLDSIKGTTPIIKNNKINKPIPKIKYISKIVQKTQPKTENKTYEKPIKSNSYENYKIEKNQINKKIKKKTIFLDYRVDFHGLSLIEAENLFKHTIKSCYVKNLRCILFITGKGILKKNNEYPLNTKLYYGKIRNNFLTWINNIELKKYILSVEQAGIEYGADGAFFVYLRKQKF